MRSLVAVACTLALSSTAPAQTVPKGVHSVVKGTSEICGVTARSAAGFEAKVGSNRALRRQPGSKAYRVFLSADRRTQWSFATRANPAFPLATCRKVIKRADRSLGLHREMRCDAPRAHCDRAFVEFHRLDERDRKSLNAARGR